MHLQSREGLAVFQCSRSSEILNLYNSLNIKIRIKSCKDFLVPYNINNHKSQYWLTTFSTGFCDKRTRLQCLSFPVNGVRCSCTLHSVFVSLSLSVSVSAIHLFPCLQAHSHIATDACCSVACDLC